MLQIKLPTKRDDVNLVLNNLFSYSEKLNTVKYNNALDETERLSRLLVNYTFKDVKLCFQKKLINCSKNNFTITLTAAQAIVLLVSIQEIPLQENEFYLQMIRNNWIDILYKQLN